METEYTELNIVVDLADADIAAAIAQMVVPYGIYIEDYSDLENEVMQIAHIDLIDEELLKRDRNHVIIHIYIPSTEHPAEAVSFLTERLDASAIRYDLKELSVKTQDWANNWKKYFKPTPVGEKLLICPTWEKIPEGNTRAVMRLDPGMAFGTGTHATTRLCLTAIEKRLPEGGELLDIGCGSGILSIGALLLGAKKTFGVDIDETAVKCALENGELNGFSEPEYTILCGDLAERVSGTYDVVAANIVADVVLRLIPDVLRYMKKDSCFIASGIVEPRLSEVTGALSEHGFTVCDTYNEEGWVCVCAQLC